MDVKLQNILNEVVSEVLNEGNIQLGNGLSFNPLTKSYEIEGQEGGFSKEKLEQMGYKVPEMGQNTMDRQNAAFSAAEDADKRSQAIEQQIAGEGTPTMGQRISDGLSSGWNATKDAVGSGYDTVSQSIQDHPYAWGAGTLGALGAGAGALYLRKKLREAKARG